MMFGALAVIVFLFFVSDCHSKSIQQNVSFDETQDERIFALESTIKKLEIIVQNVTKSKGNIHSLRFCLDLIRMTSICLKQINDNNLITKHRGLQHNFITIKTLYCHL